MTGPPEETDASSIDVSTLYGLASERALVQIVVTETRIQMTTHEARAFAFNLLSAAEAADQDGFVAEFLSGGTDALKPRVLHAFREWRTLDRERSRKEGRDGA